MSFGAHRQVPGGFILGARDTLLCHEEIDSIIESVRLTKSIGATSRLSKFNPVGIHLRLRRTWILAVTEPHSLCQLG
jgi:hypothetical protein